MCEGEILDERRAIKWLVDFILILLRIYIWVKISLEGTKKFRKTTSPFDEQENMQKSSNLGRGALAHSFDSSFMTSQL